MQYFLLSVLITLCTVGYDAHDNDYYNPIHEWDLWTPRRGICENSGIKLATEYAIYPVGLVAMNYSLVNNSPFSFTHGVHFELLKNINGTWHVVPTRASVGGIDILMYVEAGSTSDSLLDIELIYGVLEEGEYAIVKDVSLQKDNYSSRFYVFGKFSVSDTNYEVELYETNIAPRPIMYRTETSFGGDRWLIFWTLQGVFSMWHKLEHGEVFDTSNMTNLKYLMETDYFCWRN